MNDLDWPKFVKSRDGEMTGEVLSTSRRCQLAGCGGIRVGVRWPDGKLTYPCSKGLQIINRRTWKIV